MGEGASSALGLPRPPPHGRGGLLRFGSTEAPAPWARVPPPFLRPPRPPPRGQGGLLRFGTTEAPAARARGPPAVWDHRRPRRMGEGASSALGPPRPPPRERGGLLRLRGRRWSQARSPSECRGWQLVRHGGYQYTLELICVPGGTGAWGECVLVRPRTPPAGVLCGRGGSRGQATDPALETCRPNAAQSVVPGGLRAHTRETASLSPRGGGGPCRKWSRRSASPPNPCPSGVPVACKAAVRARNAGHGTRGGDEEENRRHDA